MTWMFVISTTVWVNGWDTSSVASRARSELTSSQCNWKVNQKRKGTDETSHKCTSANGISNRKKSFDSEFQTTKFW